MNTQSIQHKPVQGSHRDGHNTIHWKQEDKMDMAVGIFVLVALLFAVRQQTGAIITGKSHTIKSRISVDIITCHDIQKLLCVLTFCRY